MPTFGSNVRRLRKDAKLKGNQLAKKLKVKPPVVSGWENDRGGLPETPTLFKIAKALRCSIDDLLDGVDEDYDAIVRSRATPTTAESTAARQVEARAALIGQQLQQHVDAMAELLTELGLAQSEAPSRSGDQSDAAPPVKGHGSSRRSGTR